MPPYVVADRAELGNLGPTSGPIAAIVGSAAYDEAISERVPTGPASLGINEDALPAQAGQAIEQPRSRPVRRLFSTLGYFCQATVTLMVFQALRSTRFGRKSPPHELKIGVGESADMPA